MVDEEQLPPTVANEGTTRDVKEATQPDQTVSGFRLIQRLGEGGMGEVFEAEQLEPVRRRVALKLIKRGMESKEVLARFDSERQALALMSHPNISQVYDAGTTDDGRPYFVMEFVKGVPVTDYCDRHRLTTRERLELFTQICGGVQHAHHKGVIHRDLKPSNILVTIRDSKPVPKIIDFGIAKAIAQRLTEQSVFTQVGEFIGTPEYMSPEQADMTELDIDTRTDVYSLGVILYEMIVGAQPFDGRELRRAGISEMRRRIREDDPPRPSARLSSLGEQSTTAAVNRRSEPSTLAKQLHGDLDWITMKALEKDRTRRYESPGELASDIDRHLRNQPVSAGPPSATYRVKKFVRRHTVGVAASALVIVALVLGISGTTVGMIRARNAEQKASRKADTAQQVIDFLVGLFKVSDPTEGSFERVTAREMLDRGADQIRTELNEQPLVQAHLMSAMGWIYVEVGDFDKAQELYEGSLSIRQAELPPSHEDLARSLNQLGELARHRAQYEEAWSYYERALAIREELSGPQSMETAIVLNNMALVLVDLGRYEEAEPVFERMLAIKEQLVEPNDPELISSLNNLAILQSEMGDLDESKKLFKRILDIREETYGPDHIMVARSLNNLGAVFAESGDLESALPLYERSLAIKENVLGPDHWDVAGTLSNLGSLLEEMGQPERARPILERSVEVYRASLGPDHPAYAASLNVLASFFTSTGEWELAKTLFEESLAIGQRAFGPVHRDVGDSLYNLAYLHRSMGDYQTAGAYYERALETYESVLGPDGRDVGKTLNSHAVMYLMMGDNDRAREKLERAVEIIDDSRLIWYNLACLRALSGNESLALDALEHSVDLGYAEVDHIESDPDLESLRGTERYQNIVRKLNSSNSSE